MSVFVEQIGIFTAESLRWEDVTWKRGSSGSNEAGTCERDPIETKTTRRRSIPIIGVLRKQLLEHRRHAPQRAGLVFGITAERPFRPANLRKWAINAWQLAELEPIGLHVARHTFASLMIAAEVNAKPLTEHMGHSSIAISHDRYGHLMPGTAAQAVELIDAYVSRDHGRPGEPESAADRLAHPTPSWLM